MTIDIHLHMFGVENDENIYVSDKMKSCKSAKLLRFLLRLKKGKATNDIAREFLMEAIDKAKVVNKAVLLALDWGYDKYGNKDETRSQFWVRNGHVADLVKDRPNRLLFGASVNPDRKDAIKELHRVKKDGAVLNKLMPSSQDIDLSDTKHIPFFKEMAKLQLPLLCHCGVEHTIPCFGAHGDFENEKLQGLNSTSKIKLALECGVTVIVAHCGLPINPEDGMQDFHLLQLLIESGKYEGRLYADLSGFLILSQYRKEVVTKAMKRLNHSYLLLGSDYPVPPMPVIGGYTGGMNLEEFIDLLGSESPLDVNAKALTKYGFKEEVLHNAYKVLGTT